MMCQQRDHDPRPGRRHFRPAPHGRTAILCDPCVARHNALGDDWRLDLRVDPDRRYKGREQRLSSWLPEWRRRDNARDLTGASR
jgi:hypothetical protein